MVVIMALLGMLMWTPAMAQSVFEQGRDASLSVQGLRDGSGVTIRGRYGLDLNLRNRPVEILRNRTEVGTTCGGFEFRETFRSNIERIPGLLEDILDAFIAELPRLLLCYASPTLCDLHKHFESFMNAVVTWQKADCAQLQTAMAAAGLKLRGGQAAKCLENAQAAGDSLDVALDECLAVTSNLRTPRGVEAGTFELFSEVAEAAGMNTGDIQLINGILGTLDISTRAQGIAVNKAADHNGVHFYFEDLKEEITEHVDTAISKANSGTLTPDDIRRISVPGQATPAAVLDQLAMMLNDPARFQPFRSKLIGGLSIAKLDYEVRELQSKLQAATDGNKHLDDEERQTMEQAVKKLGKELDRLVKNKETSERHLQPVMDAILSEGASIQAEAGQALIRTGSNEAINTGMPSGQTVIGYTY